LENDCFSRYDINKIFGVISVTIGITIVTFIEGQNKASLPSTCPTCDPLGNSSTNLESQVLFNSEFVTWATGIGLLFFALILSSVLGFYQEWMYAAHGNNWREGIFWTHLLGLTAFIPFIYSGDLLSHWENLWQSPTYRLFDIDFIIPCQIVYYFINLFTQYLCIYGVYMLTGTAGTLTCTLTITIRKFASLLFSIYFFGHKFTAIHWFGTFLVFIGGTFYGFLKLDTWFIRKNKEKIN
jgi:UDP-xylose/UDP-N-acetylglucosamine transporter B4